MLVQRLLHLYTRDKVEVRSRVKEKARCRTRDKNFCFKFTIDFPTLSHCDTNVQTCDTCLSLRYVEIDIELDKELELDLEAEVDLKSDFSFFRKFFQNFFSFTPECLTTANSTPSGVSKHFIS